MAPCGYFINVGSLLISSSFRVCYLFCVSKATCYRKYQIINNKLIFQKGKGKDSLHPPKSWEENAPTL